MTKRTGNKSDTVAALDLGSNSFHMKVLRSSSGDVTILDRMRESVRLAAGLTDDNFLSDDAQARALDFLARIGQRLRDIPEANVRAVGTNTLRKARNSRIFLIAAEKALGHSIEIISGVEEARLIYLGVAHSLPEDEGKRLVVDIGGGSTEVIIGERFEPINMNSLYMGCVSTSRRFFADGKITAKRMRRAEFAALLELETIATRYRQQGWSRVIGASGTVRAISSVSKASGWDEDGISRSGIASAREAVIDSGHVDQLNLAGLSDERVPVFAGGLAVLSAIFEALDVAHMTVSDGALREGLIYDILGRIHHEDVRSRSVLALATRYHVDTAHAARVSATAREFLHQVAAEWTIDAAQWEEHLDWAAQLHEIGLDIAHSQYHKHGAYVVEHADLSGFSWQEQQVLAALIRSHRRKFPYEVFKSLAPGWTKPVRRLAILFRLAAVLHRSRSSTLLPSIHLKAGKKSLKAKFPEAWLDQHPLTETDLSQEASYLAEHKFKLEFT